MWNGIERRKAANGSILKLRELTSLLPTVIDISNGYKLYRVGKETAFSWILHRVGNDLLVQRWFISADGEWKQHTHEGLEIIYIYQGEIKTTIDGIEHRYITGDVIKIDAGVKHNAFFPLDTKAIVITAPIEKEYV